MTAYVFDIDGVICDRGSKIDPDFKQFFKNWAQGKNIYFLTGSNREKNIDQVGQDILDLATISFHCLGNSIWIQEQEVCVNQFLLKQEEYDFLNCAVLKSDFNNKTGSHIEYRKGSVNFSIVGKNASPDDRNLYISYDKVFNEREKIIKDFKKRFERLDMFLGGDVSLDICLRGADKSQCFTLIQHPMIHFFGDRCHGYGIDAPFAERCTGDHKVSQINNGFRETWNILQTI